MKVDLCMWTKNAERFLPVVLRRIDKVIPQKHVNQKILIDDHSQDWTTHIAKSFNWTVFENPKSGISSGANEALRRVKTEFFVSFEQDILLAQNWWERISKHLADEKVALACGIRIASFPKSLACLQEYIIERSQYLEFTLDNTMYRTQVIRSIGGFPHTSTSTGVDTILASRLLRHGYAWKVDRAVKSIHIRQNFKDEFRHYYWYAHSRKHITKLLEKETSLIQNLRIFFLSPLRAIPICIEKKDPQIFFIYPLLRFYLLKGLLEA